jgi:CSLREA domain-containing protein
MYERQRRDKMRQKRFWTVALVLAVALGVQPVPVAHAATITVNTTFDEFNNDGDCSLREAILAANTNSAVDGCTGGWLADTITLPAGTYTDQRGRGRHHHHPGGHQ